MHVLTTGMMESTKADVKDLVLNESFQKWVLEPDDARQNFWNNWLEQHPEKTEAVNEARSLVLNIKNSFEENVEDDLFRTWENVEKSIDSLESGNVEKSKKVKTFK